MDLKSKSKSKSLIPNRALDAMCTDTPLDRSMQVPGKHSILAQYALDAYWIREMKYRGLFS